MPKFDIQVKLDLHSDLASLHRRQTVTWPFITIITTVKSLSPTRGIKFAQIGN